MILQQNSDFLFLFEAVLTNPNGDPDQENRPRVDYETSTLLVSDARRKRDVRDQLKRNGYEIFVDTIGETKVSADTMFEALRDRKLLDEPFLHAWLERDAEARQAWEHIKVSLEANDVADLLQKAKAVKDKGKKAILAEFNSLFITELVKQALVDVRLFGSAMTVENVNRTFTGPVQLTWGYSLHPVELVQSNTIASIMNDGSSTFGKKHKVHYALCAHYGTINKFNARKTGMTDRDRDLFRRMLVQGMMGNQTDSKQGQTPLAYMEIVYKPGFDGFLGDLRRFLHVDAPPNKPIRRLSDLTADFGELTRTINSLIELGYVEQVIGWRHPFVQTNWMNFPEYIAHELWSSIDSPAEA